MLGWMFLWFLLEMVFYGEPIFRYSSSSTGYSLYFVELALVGAIVIASAIAHRRVAAWSQMRVMPVAAGCLGSLSLIGIHLATGDFLPEEAILPVAGPCMVAFAASSCLLLSIWFSRLSDLVYVQGLQEVLLASLLGITLSFIVLPRFLRSSGYGVALVVSSCLAVGIAYAPFRTPSMQASEAAASDQTHADEKSRAMPRILLTLCMLGCLSGLAYLLTYIEFVNPGFSIMTEENPYLYGLLFVFIAALVVIIASSSYQSYLKDNLFLYTLVGLMFLTFLVVFASRKKGEANSGQADLRDRAGPASETPPPRFLRNGDVAKDRRSFGERNDSVGRTDKDQSMPPSPPEPIVPWPDQWPT